MNAQTVKRFAVLTAAAGLSVWAIDMVATQVGLPSMQAALGVSVTASQWILNLTLIILAGIVTVGGSLGDRMGRMRIFRIGIIGIIVGAAITFVGGLSNAFPIVLVGRGLEGLAVAFFFPASTALLLVGPGSRLPEEQQLRLAIVAGAAGAQAAINARINADPFRNGWTVPDSKIGTAGPHILSCATCQLIALGAFPSAEAIYFFTTRDSEIRPFNGSHKYTLTFPKGQIPPLHLLGFNDV